MARPTYLLVPLVPGDDEPEVRLTADHVLPWLAGHLAGMTDLKDARLASEKIDEMPPKINADRRRSLALTICHDHGIITYVGMVREEDTA